MKKRRVAFCFSGQIRTWKSCYPMWRKLMDEFDIEPDIFVHTWDHDTEQQRVLTWNDGKPDYTPNYGVDEYINTLKPKKHKIDTRSKAISCMASHTNKIKKYLPDLEWHEAVGWLAPQFYSMMYSSFLKQEYETENKFEYDLVFKFRNDLLLTDYDINRIMTSVIIPHVLDDLTMYTVHSGESDVPISGFARVGDIFFIAPSRIYDMICNFYRMIPYIFSRAFDGVLHPPELYMAYYIKSLQLSFIDLGLNVKIARTKDYERKLKDNELSPLDCDIIIDEQ